MSSTIIITNCTNRKRMVDATPLRLPQRSFASLDEMTDAWINQIEATEIRRLPAESLYAGRSVQDAKRAAARVNARLMFASTGLGLVEGDFPSPLYNLTVGNDADSIRDALASLDASPSDWWTRLNGRYRMEAPIAAIASNATVDVILVALSASYIDLIRNDLLAIDKSSRGKFRIFTSRPGVEKLPEPFKKYAMPYDERLESTTYAGTRADFPQRALRHFVENNWVTYSSDDSQQAVTVAMGRLKMTTRVSRRRASDEEVISLLKSAWTRHDGSSSRLLRYLRDDALVSCEQSRFRGLWVELKAGYATRSKA
ncbi:MULTISPECIES: hypothetical protein [Stutzerimonas]|uniref:hypothetical protein n=1 Tax=Stutzerimonas TaxID=2901164 RepID=UPI0028AD11CE|nr:hypothetical protein [Stutzerimonas nitrititolerans]